MVSVAQSQTMETPNRWMSDLVGLEPCRFPRFGKCTNVPTRSMSTRVPLGDAEKLQEISTVDNPALSAVLRAAWALLLRCYTGQDNVCFGYHHAGQCAKDSGLPSPSGVHSGMTVVRFIMDDSMSLAKTLEQSQGEFGPTIQNQSPVTSQPSNSAECDLFDTAVVFRDLSNPAASRSGFAQPPLNAISAKYQLSLLVKRGHGGVSLFIEWCSSLMSLAQANLVASTLDRIITEILCSPETILADLDCFSGKHMDRVLKWNEISIERSERCIHDVIYDQVLIRPESEAVCAWDGSFSYRELDELAAQLAAQLVEMGVRPETFVPLCFDKSKWTIVAMLGVLKAGGAFVPFDPSHPVERLRALSRSVDAKLLLCSRQHVQLLASVADVALAVDEDALRQPCSGNLDEAIRACSTNAAYVIFTSGSTGEPKGTVIEHSAYCSSAKTHAPAMHIYDDCRVLQFAAHTFDASLVEILTPLMCGACVCIPSEDDRLNNITGVINEMRVNHAVLTPSFISFVDPAAVPGLRTLVLAGEAMSPAHVATWSRINLVNGYGPAESSVTAVVNRTVTAETDPKDIGFPVGMRCWIADPSNHDRLVPVGCVGELLLEGPNLARGYLNNPGKTEESFIFNPAWLRHDRNSPQNRRFYKTGDLVRYNSDQGSLTYVGRKDTQIKFHGQRIELGEIEHHLTVEGPVQHGLVLLPKTGPFRQKLVAVISVASTSSQDDVRPGSGLNLIDPAIAGPQIEDVRKRVSARLPAYMVPSTWLCVEQIPMLPSRKLDRNMVRTWVETMSTELFVELLGSSASTNEGGEPATETEAQLRSIWSRVLNIPLNQVSLERSFLSLGGDSITAMTCMSQAKKLLLGLTVQEILRSKSLRQLATWVKPVEGTVDYEEVVDEPFELSPIQQLHFQTRNVDQGHFNQSFFLRLARETDEQTLREAVKAIVERHSMLRARFSPSGTDGVWQQHISPDADTSYRFRSHRVNSREEVNPAIADAQSCLDEQKGPMFAAELFSVNGNEQLLFMVGHHLVIDLVSWRVILEDLEEMLENPAVKSTAEKSLPFQTWCRLQKEHCQDLPLKEILPNGDVPAADFEFWGMENKENIYGHVACEGFEINSAVTSALLTECHKPLKTETVDILLSALLYSFRSTFAGRSVPAIYNEGHGREPPSPDIDVSRTVGWFTTIYPVSVQVGSSDPFVETVKRVKDLRRRVPGNGRPYFARRFLTDLGKSELSHHSPMEVTFNFLGQYQQLEREGALLQPAEFMAGEAHVGGSTADFASETPRFGLFEISAVIVQGKLRFSFTFNRFMKYQREIRTWISRCQETLVDASRSLVMMRSQPTLTDFPLLPLTYESLDAMQREQLPQAGISAIADIEDMYPCSPMQQGLLLSRTKDASHYAVCRTFEVTAAGDASVDKGRLLDAWHQVVAHHALLRTIFVESLCSEGSYDQIVLKAINPSVICQRCDSEQDMRTALETQLPMEYDERRPPHRFSIFYNTDKVFCKLELSHAIMDGASMSIIFRDLGLGYAGKLQTLPKPLYSNFIAYLKDLDHDGDIAYWASHLSGLEPCHFPLLNDGVSDSRQLQSIRLDFKELMKLQEFCDNNGLTLANAFHAAWSLTLRCYTGSEDVCFGYLMSGRQAQVLDSESAVGPFINMATCRVTLPGQSSLREVLDQIQKDYIDSLPHCQASLAEVQHALKLSGIALFNTCISYRRLPSTQTADESPIQFSDIGPIDDPTEYPISLNIEVSDEDAYIDLDYWTDSISPSQAANVASVFTQSLRNIINCFSLPISQLDHLSDDMKQTLWTWNSNMPPMIDDCVHFIIEKQARLQPESQAIFAWDGKFTYSELNELSDRLAHYLVDFGVGPEILVPICFEKSAWTVISMLAVLKAGGGCVPLDANHPPSALETRVMDTSAHVVLTAENRADVFENMVPYVIVVNSTLLEQLPRQDTPVESTVQPSNPSFIIFTSGSTGKPKGVVLEHRAIVTSAEAHGSALGVGPHTRFLQFAAYTFDNSLEEMFTTLMRGGCVCIPSENDRFNNLANAINELDVNFMDLTPTVAALLRPSDVPKVKALSVGGEALTQEVAEIWRNVIPVHNQYGPSECSINAAHYLVSGKPGDVACIGKSVGSVSWVVHPDDHNRLVPIGCVGELLIEGPILARGYLGDEEKTSKSFIVNPEWVMNDPHGSGRIPRRMYKTGDLVRYTSDGNMFYLGRKDTQVKLNGQRIELGEIEHHVKVNLPSDAQSAVELVNTPGSSSSKALAAFIYLPSLDDSASNTVEDCILPMSDHVQAIIRSLEESISSRIATYMVPSMYIPVSRMPLTTSGKLDRRSLRQMVGNLSEQDALTYRLGGKSGRTPSTKMEKELQQLWASVLKINAASIGADDSFFRHGGDSIGAMRLVAAAKAKGIAVSVASIFQAPKLSDLALAAKLLSSSSQNDTVQDPVEPFSLLSDEISPKTLKEEVASICRVDLDSIEDIYPCTTLQEGLVAVSNMQPGAYVAMNSFQLPSGIDIPKFKQAWQQAVDNEAILRTRIAFVKSVGFLQVVVRDQISWETIRDLESLPDSYRHLPPHDGGILSRYAIFGGNTEAPTFLWTAHHALYDGWSLPVLLRRVAAIYYTSQLPSQPIPHFSRFIEYLKGIDAEESDRFWENKLSGSTASQFPQLPNPSYEVKATSQVSKTLAFSKPRGFDLTTASFLRAAWALVVSIYSSSDDVVFGEILTGRDVPVPGVEDLVGPTLASIPRRIIVNRDMSVSEFINDVQKQLNDAIPYQFSGIQRIRKLSSDAAAACDFQNLLAINGVDEETPDDLWKTARSETNGTNFFSYLLNLSCTIGKDKIDVDAYFDRNVIPEWLASRLLSQLECTLARMTLPNAKSEKMGDIQLLSSEDEATIFNWNARPLTLVEKCVHKMFEEQVAVREDSTAVLSWDATLSYKELDQLSSALAHRLSEFGVEPSSASFVPICFEKSAFAIVAMLAVLKAGAAFVPLDPTHPVNRLQEIVDDVSAGLVLCSPCHTSICESVAARAVAVDLNSLQQMSKPHGVPVSCKPSDTAYVIFTSGTTGKPKGTMITHSAFCSGAAAHGPAMLMTPPFRFLQFASYTFDASMVEILTTLIFGGTVCVPSEFDRMNNITAAMENMEVDTALLTPSFAQVIKPADVPHMRTLILGGEAMSQNHVSTWAGKLNLVNAYGPSECAVVATVKAKMTTTTSPSNIGTGLDRCWIVDPRNHHRLAPIGSVGELLVEGPTLSSGYLNNEAKTSECFIEDPKWSQKGFRYSDTLPSRRMYKTGDLVRIGCDLTGEMIYVGRKDSQAKLNGQRLEIEEIDHHLNADDRVQHVAVALLKSGRFSKRLVAVLSLRGHSATNTKLGDLQVVTSDQTSTLSGIQDRLRDHLPPYMIPSKWIVVEKIPLLPSGKLDRRRVASFLENMDDDTYDKITNIESGSGENKSSPFASIEQKLQLIWSQVLNLELEKVGLNVSFLHLGGDSIAAMQVMARCRSEGISVTVQDIIRSKSILDLAGYATIPEQVKYDGEDSHEFDLSPIQQLYFKLVGNKTGQFNQSILLHLNGESTASEVGHAVNALVTTHSMLRSRFRRDGTGNWRQRITSDVKGSYRFRSHNITSAARMKTRIEDSQKALNVQKGPMMAVDLFNIGKTEFQLFITAHHLVIDVVSWNIILQDLEEFFKAGKMKPPRSMPFQSWCRLQSETAQQENGELLLPHKANSAADFSYWGIPSEANTYGHVINEDIEFDESTTALLLGECHQSLQTDTLDILLAALLQSYGNVFSDRGSAPTIYNEGHGREPWDEKIDLSRTVGWFTTLCPISLPSESSSDSNLISAIRWVKDYRRRLPCKGRSYFAYRLLTSEGGEQYGHHWPMEIAFNYLGQMQQLNRKDSFFQPAVGGQSVNTLSDIGVDVPRFALIEISAVVADGKMRVSFGYNKEMKHQDKIQKWIQLCQNLIQQAPEKLASQKAERTLSDFPLLPLTYHGVQWVTQSLQDAGLDSLLDVEDIYPCSPMQRGLLLSQMKDPEKYSYKMIFEIQSPKTGQRIDLESLADSWQAVVKQHPSLRTIFIESVGRDGFMDQVVLRNMPGKIARLDCEDSDVKDVLENLELAKYGKSEPPHRLTLCTTNAGRVFGRLDISHVISDGTSMPILLQNLADAYGGDTKSLISVPPYRDYIAYLQSKPRDESIRYWKRYLEEVEPCLFPALNDGTQETKGSLGSHIISLQGVNEVHAFCKASGVTLSTLLQFVWALVVRVYTGSEDVCFGYLASGRDIDVENIDRAVGAFINMLVCRLHVPDDMELLEALDKIQMDFGSGVAHQSCSLAEIQHELGLSDSSLFNTAFTYQKRRPTSDNAQSALSYNVLEAQDPSEYDIAINVEATGARIEVHFSYWTRFLSDQQAQNVAITFQQVLSDILKDQRDGRTVGDLNYLGEVGFQTIRDWNSSRPPKIEKTIHEIIEQNASSSTVPKPAICGWDASFTYPELDKTATRLARHLISLGVGPEVYVPLLFEKSAWTVIAQVAVLKAGGAFVNLDPSHPEARLQHLINDVGANVVLCSSKYREKAEKVSKVAYVVDRQAIENLPDLPGAKLQQRAKPSNPAYIIFTSGTTGQPKGTVIEHGSYCTSAFAHSKAMYMRPTSRVFQFASYTFDACMMEILTTLLIGGCVCVPSDQDRLSDIPGVIRKMGVTWALLTPSVVSTIKPESVPSLKVLVTGGEAMAAGHTARWGTRCALVNAYGPTECAVIATTSTKVDERHQMLNEDRFNIGTAVGCRSWVVDHRNFNRLMPIGAVGELVLEGRVVARGYLNNPKKTSEVFLKDPSWTKSSQFVQDFGEPDRMYRTGDLVRYNSDGSICYISRKDTQIKLNGQRIELGEIEHQCRNNLPEQAQAAVELVVPSSRVATKALAVFFSVPTEDIQPTSADELLIPMDESLQNIARKLESSLGKVLPTYMVPQLFVPVFTMPFMSSGKLDRRKLRQSVENLSKETIALYRLTSPASKRNASTEMERTLQGLWESVMKLPAGSVGAEDNFFKIGGDSLAAMSLVGAARAQNISLTVTSVFQKPKLADMAIACEALSEEVQTALKSYTLIQSERSLDEIIQEMSDQCRVRREHIQDIYPCSSLQEGLVTLSSKQFGAYIAIITLEIPENIDLALFKAAWQKVVDDTDTLRTRIVHTTGSGFLQAVLKEERIKWHSESSVEEASTKGRSLSARSGGPLTRYAIVEGNEGSRPTFVWAVHHALYDGWSLPIILKQVQDVYANESATSEQCSYAKFIQYLQMTDVSASERFWRACVDGASEITHFPPTPPAMLNARPKFHSAHHRVHISRRDLLPGITVPTLIRAAWAVLVAAYSGTNDVVFGETLAGRNIDVAGITDMVGPTFTTVPMRIRFDQNMKLSQFLANIHRMTSDMVPHQHLGLQHVKRLNDDAANACNFLNMLVIQTPQEDILESLWDFESGNLGDSFFTHPLVVECKVFDSSIEASFHHNENVISTWHASQLLHQFDTVLKRLATASKSEDATMMDIDVISPEDQNTIANWNSRVPETVDSCIHDLFVEKAHSQPNAQAICAWDDNLSYGETLDYASRLAQHLVKQGVGPEYLVPICLDRSAWTIVSIMGVLLAGGAFVPMDPSHPSSRQRTILEEVEAKLLLCAPESASQYTDLVNSVISIDKATLKNLPESDSRKRFSRRASGRNTAYVIFTSGSTGRPKGVVVEHNAFCSSTKGYAEAMHLEPDSRAFHFASLTFDVALMEVLSSLIIGACVCVPHPEERLKDTAGAMDRLKVTWSFLTPSVANLIDPSSVPTLKTLVCGGEAMLTENVTKWADHVELMNGYGPTETSVIVVVNSNLSTNRDASIIGQGTSAVVTWIVDPTNHNKLSPVGAVGELAISGPIVAREYLKNPQKTAEVFIENPPWATNFAAGPKKFYKTGDLVRYKSDGMLEFIGRKDNQVKVNGQRMELGEIENRLITDNHIRHALVVLPKSGACKKQLVAVVSLRSLTSEKMSLSSGSCEIVDGAEQVTKARADLTKIRSHLSESLPHYMVPHIWIAITQMPMVVSGKLDRKEVAKWVSSFDEATFERIMSVLSEEEDEVEVTPTMKTLQGIWAKELNLPVEKVKLNKPFLSLGGDSITAMAIMSRCRKEKINVSLQDVLKCKSITHLAQLVSSTTVVKYEEEIIDKDFDPSPVQQMYFQLASTYDGRARFNQSFLLRIARRTQPDLVKGAIESIVHHHSMLRSRFRKNQDGDWQQRIIKMDESSYRYMVHYINSQKEIAALVAEGQMCLNIERGPVFAVNLFDIAGQGQMIFLTAHHLVVDVVSWRIILQDLQELLETGSLPVDKPLSFQTWCALQSEHVQRLDSKDLLPFYETLPNVAYWDMEDKPNTYSQIESESFMLNEELTTLALGDAQKAFDSEPVDLFLAAIAHSFARTFTDRDIPTLYTESHGREAPSNMIVDLSRTVGWFTTICPLVIPTKSISQSIFDVLNTVKHTKDIRRSVPENGRPYFAHRFLTAEGRSRSRDGSIPMEIIFNYLGKMQHLENDDSLLQQAEVTATGGDQEATSELGPDTTRMALFEISAMVLSGSLKFTFMYNRNIKQVGEVPRWISECKNTLEEMIGRLAETSPEPTLSNYPLLPATYEGLRKLTQEVFSSIGVDHFSQVEDIYPCSSVQEGMLISQLRDPSAYIFHAIAEAKHTNPDVKLDAQKFGQAWHKIVHRHAALRTVFIDSVDQKSVFDQVVVKNVDSGVIYIQCEDAKALETLKTITIHDGNFAKKPRLPHQLTVCETSAGRLLIKLEINHVVIDGGSLPILLEDLIAEYKGLLEDGPGPLYSNYIKYIRSQPSHADTRFWMTYLKGVRPCYFPIPNGNVTTEKHLRAVKMDFNRFSELQQLSEKIKVTLANIIHVAWTVVLQKFTGEDDVCFGYLTAGRDAPVDQIERTVGTFINMLCCRINPSKFRTVEEMFRATQEEYLESLPYQHCSLALVQHDLGLAGKPLYNTTMSVQNHSKEVWARADTIVFEMEHAYDPSEFAITVNVETARDNEALVFRYWSNQIGDEVANEVSRTMVETLENFLAQLSQPVQSAEIAIQPAEQPTSKPQLPKLGIEHQISSSSSEPSSVEDISEPDDGVICDQLGLKDAEMPKQKIEKEKNPDSTENSAYRPLPRPLLPPVEKSAAVTLEGQGATTQPAGLLSITSADLKQIVQECVQQTIEHMIKSGALVKGSTETGVNIAHQQPLQVAQNDKHTVEELDTSMAECNSDSSDDKQPDGRSMAAQINKRGRSAHTEKKLLAIWASLLDLQEESINVQDSFFELGGDSIVAMKLVGAAREEGLALTVADVFRHPSFEDMAAIIRVASMMSTYVADPGLREYPAGNDPIDQTVTNDLYKRFSLINASNVDAFLQSNICPQVGIFKGGIADVLPATDFQSLAVTGALLESRWMLNYFYLDGSGALDLRQLKRSCFRLVQALDILRTVFIPAGDRFVQVILRKLRPDFQVFEIEESLDEFASSLQQRDRDECPKLGEPFVKFVVAKQRSSARHRIFIRISHAQYDGVCLPKIMAALQAAYQGDHLPSPPSFTNYLRASAGSLTSDHYQHWKSLLKGSSMTEVVRRNGPNYRRSAGTTSCLKRVIHLPAVEHGHITIATVVKAAWAYVLAQLSATPDVVFGHTISGRNATVRGVENIIGPCLNLVPVRIQFEQSWTALDLLHHIQDQQITNMQYEVLGFREIIKHCTDWPDWTNFTTTVQHQNIDLGSQIELGDTTYRLGAVATDEDFSDISILSTPQVEPDMVEIALSVSTNGAMTTAFAERALSMLCTAAENFAKNPNFRLLSSAELSKLPLQTLEETLTTSGDELFQSASLQRLSHAELLVLSDILGNAWRQVLPNGGEGHVSLHFDSSFFDLDGDIVGLAQLTWLLEQEGFKVRLEDLIDHPTMLGQMALLSSQNIKFTTKALKQLRSQSSTPRSPGGPTLVSQEPIPLQKTGRVNSFIKAVGLAKKIVKKNTRPTAPVTPL